LAPRLSQRCEPLQTLVRAGLLALALLGLGEAAPAAFPVAVTIEAHGADLQVTVDGQSHSVSSALGGPWQRLTFEQPTPLEREYQVDGSDTTATGDRSPAVLAALLSSPLYQFDAWLRDESSYSRWEHASVTDLATGRTLSLDTPLPSDFRVDAALRRPEAAARLWLVGQAPNQREGLELDRDKRNARWLVQRNGATEALPRWFFPEQPAPFAAELVNLVGRAAAAAYALALAAFLISCAIRTLPLVHRLDLKDAPRARVQDVLLGGWLLAAALVTTRLYHQLPHVLDAVSYTFQASLFASGQLALPAPPVADAFKGPFEVVWQGRMFSQYPPGAPAVYALGQIVGLEWLVGPLACLVLIGTTAWTARALYGPGCSLAVLGLGVLSPFVLFQAGSFLSHPIAAGWLAAALAAFVAGERRRDLRWYGLCGVLLGGGLLSREAASVLFALPLSARLVGTRNWRALVQVVVCGLPFVLVYLLYDQRLTGSPFLLPRTIFDAADHFGFGNGIGFHGRHTLAAGLANTDELLTILQFDLFGWPPLFALGLIGMPLLVGHARSWDLLAAGGFAVFVVAYAAYFYHGIALGPRYYFEAMPWLLLLAGRAVQILARLARSRLAAIAVVGLLMLNTLLFYLPAELQRRADLSGLPGGSRVNLTFVQSSLFGPKLVGVPSRALVVTDDWWLFNTSLAALNCPRLPECGIVFALASSPRTLAGLQSEYPDRVLLHAVRVGDSVTLSP
jgi:hypothetical protein